MIIFSSKNNFLIIALITLVVSTIITIVADLFDNELLFLLSMPGFIVYVLATGDIHGWQPGPIGHVGRLIVTTFGSWIIWTPMIYWIYKKKMNKKGINR